MASVQIWYYQNLVPDLAGMAPILKEPWVAYRSATVTTESVQFTVPAGARYAAVEPDATIHYKAGGNPTASADNCPGIGATSFTRYILDVSEVEKLAFIGLA